MFGWGFLIGTIFWVGLIEWRTTFFSSVIKSFFSDLWSKIKLKIKNKVNNW